jgi:type IV pilus assembly protein PilM
MAWLSFSSKKVLGVDIGTSAVRIVELGKRAEKISLENYGEIQGGFLHNKPLRIFEKGVLSLSTRDIAATLTSILRTAKIRSRAANFSLPDFSSFFTTFQLPSMTQNELSEAVKFEARQHIPLPISEMALDWILTKGKPAERKEEKLEVLLVAVPNRVVEQYREIARLADLELKNLEAEVFALRRALFNEGQGQKTTALIDIGATTTTCSIIDGGVLKMSHSIQISGDDLTKGLINILGLDLEVAEKIKLRHGLSPESRVIHRALQSLLDSVIIEIEKISRHFLQTEGKEVKEIVLTGGTANLRGIREYFFEKLKREIKIADPFVNIIYPRILEKTLRESGPFWAVAVGAGLRGLE